MNAAKKGLGRGLSALFGDIEKKPESKEFQTNKVPIADLDRKIFNFRKLNLHSLESLFI